MGGKPETEADCIDIPVKGFAVQAFHRPADGIPLNMAAVGFLELHHVQNLPQADPCPFEVLGKMEKEVEVMVGFVQRPEGNAVNLDGNGPSGGPSEILVAEPQIFPIGSEKSGVHLQMKKVAAAVKAGFVGVLPVRDAAGRAGNPPAALFQHLPAEIGLFRWDEEVFVAGRAVVFQLTVQLPEDQPLQHQRAEAGREEFLIEV